MLNFNYEKFEDAFQDNEVSTQELYILAGFYDEDLQEMLTELAMTNEGECDERY